MIDTLKERELNLKDIPHLKHVDGNIYSFKGIEINMEKCGSQHMQMYKHIAIELAKIINNNEI